MSGDLEGRFQAWIEGKATPAVIRHVKSTLFDQLRGENDLQVEGLLTKLLDAGRESRATTVGNDKGESDDGRENYD